MTEAGLGPVLEARGLSVSFEGSGRSAAAAERVDALQDVSARFAPGRLAVVLGPSGSGKSTLLHALAGLVVPRAGEVVFEGAPVSALSEGARDAWRRRHCGLVFQDFRLVDELDALSNVTLPVLFEKVRVPPPLRERAAALLGAFGVPARRQSILRLSRGERQRVALARALLLEPAIILADEPTASLDRANAEAIAEALNELAHRDGKIVVAATHDERLSARADTVLHLEAGRVARAEETAPSPVPRAAGARS